MNKKTVRNLSIIITSLLLISVGITILFLSLNQDNNKTPAGETLFTHIDTPEVGKIAIRVDVPHYPRYGVEGAPIVVIASTWFVEMYNYPYVGFCLKHQPNEIGAITVTNLWPGKTDPISNFSSDGVYDYGGPDCIASLRDTILFAAGEKPNIDGLFIDDLLAVTPITTNIGLYASSHAGVVATNVLAYHYSDLTVVDYFVGRENPTRDEMYSLEIGHFDLNRNPVVNPYYHLNDFHPTLIHVNYSQLGWLVNSQYPQGIPFYSVPQGNDYILSENGPHIHNKRYFSQALTQALSDNNVFGSSPWPDTIATPTKVANFWPYRIAVNNYETIENLSPDLKVLLVFASQDHVLSPKNKPHIHQAYIGFHKTANLWVRLNADNVYFQALDEELDETYSEHPANNEPINWTDVTNWGYTANYGSERYVQTGSLAAIAEMADRTRVNNWSNDLTHVLYQYETTNAFTTTNVDEKSILILSVLEKIKMKYYSDEITRAIPKELPNN